MTGQLRVMSWKPHIPHGILSTHLTGHKQEAGGEAEQLGHELVPIWDLSLKREN